jgi:PTH1 family peptidyl-tRNA hydrolase
MARLLLGLGNPGPDYRATRHNLGFLVAEAVAARRGLVIDREECGSLVAEEVGLLIAQPQTYMNRSGYAARCLVEARGLAISDILVVYDDLALELGRLRLRPGGGPAGHRGLESIVENLRTDQVPRLRLGIRDVEQVSPTGEALVDFVLGEFPAGQLAAVQEMVNRAADAVEHWLEAGIVAAMGRFNAPAAAPGGGQVPGPAGTTAAAP